MTIDYVILIMLSKKPITTKHYTLSLHDALPIYVRHDGAGEDQGHDAELDAVDRRLPARLGPHDGLDRKSTRLNSSHLVISYAVFCLKKKKNKINEKCYKKNEITLDICAQYIN